MILGHSLILNRMVYAGLKQQSSNADSIEENLVLQAKHFRHWAIICCIINLVLIKGGIEELRTCHICKNISFNTFQQLSSS